MHVRRPEHLRADRALVDRHHEHHQADQDAQPGEPAGPRFDPPQPDRQADDGEGDEEDQQRPAEPVPADPAEPFAERRAVEHPLQVGGPDVVRPERLHLRFVAEGIGRDLGGGGDRPAAEDQPVAAVAQGDQAQQGEGGEEPDLRRREAGEQDEDAAEHRAGGRLRSPHQHPEGGEEHEPEDVGTGVDRLQRGGRGEHGEYRQGAAQPGVADRRAGGDPDDDPTDADGEPGDDRHRGRRVVQRDRAADLADQPRDHHQIARVGFEDVGEEAVVDRAAEEDRPVLRPHRVERVARADPQQLQDRREHQEGDDDDGHAQAVEAAGGIRAFGEEGAVEMASHREDRLPGAAQHRGHDTSRTRGGRVRPTAARGRSGGARGSRPGVRRGRR